MIQLSDEQLNNLGKDALVILVSSLQDQLLALQSQLDHANAQLSDTNRQIELLTEQIRILNQRHFGRKSEANLSDMEGQLFSLWTSIMSMSMLPGITTEPFSGLPGRRIFSETALPPQLWSLPS